MRIVVYYTKEDLAKNYGPCQRAELAKELRAGPRDFKARICTGRAIGNRSSPIKLADEFPAKSSSLCFHRPTAEALGSSVVLLKVYVVPEWP